MWLRGKREENILKGYKCGKALKYAFAFDSKRIGFRHISAIQLQATYPYKGLCIGAYVRRCSLVKGESPLVLATKSVVIIPRRQSF